MMFYGKTDLSKSNHLYAIINKTKTKTKQTKKTKTKPKAYHSS